ncbi:outer membrane lipoprotein carrier protein LolA [Thermopetrobacter sp. TC1]|uniref:LolA family protein n=1 Tax=Thermopetrobacter sp. TC1 TaxID=1495045 RepID=UPI0018CF968D|nr:outer membrane lipoprotein carrier protein LolA [Thermopetrobacter sp. TC1]
MNRKDAFHTPRITRRRLLSGATAAITAGVWFKSAGAAFARALSREERAAVQRISDFFNSFTTLKGEFTQISPRGRVSTGKVFIAKPGRMRFEYTPPHPLVIVSDGSWVAVRNNRKDTVDYYPLSQTPLRMILRKRVDLLRDTIVKSVERRDDLLIVTLQDRKGDIPGQLILVYDERRKQLQQWIVVDGQGRRTTVTLSGLEPNVKLSANLFRVKRKGLKAYENHKKTNFGARRR